MSKRSGARGISTASLRSTVAALVAMGSLLAPAGCERGGAPAYVRLAGDAPAVGDAPGAAALLVVFWATWCSPCRAEAPSLRALADDPPEALAVVVLGHDPDEGAVRAFFGGEPPRSLHFRLDAGKRVGQAFGVDRLPVSYLVVDGRLAARFSGPHEWNGAAMRSLLARLVRESKAP